MDDLLQSAEWGDLDALVVLEDRERERGAVFALCGDVESFGYGYGYGYGDGYGGGDGDGGAS